MSMLEKVLSLSDIKYRRVLVLTFDGAVNGEPVYKALLNTGCDLVGVSSYAPDNLTAICRRASAKRKFMLSICPFTDIYAMRASNNKHNDFNSNMVHLLKDWLMVGYCIMCNFTITDPQKSMTARDLDAKWTSMGLSNNQIEWCIIEAEERAKMKRPRTEENLTATMGRIIQRARKENQYCTKTSAHKMPADSPNYVKMEDFQNIDTVVCRTFNVLTGAMVECQLLDWVQSKHYVQYALVMHGMACAGNTEWAKHTLANLAIDLSEDNG